MFNNFLKKLAENLEYGHVQSKRTGRIFLNIIIKTFAPNARKHRKFKQTQKIHLRFKTWASVDFFPSRAKTYCLPKIPKRIAFKISTFNFLYMRNMLSNEIKSQNLKI